MDSSTLSQLSNTVGGVAGTTLLKKAQDIAGQQAQQLISGLPSTPSPSPQGVGDNIDTYG